MASCKLCLLFCSIVILSNFISSTESASCCLMYAQRRLPCIRLIDYTVQTINTSCDINAIIFHVRGRFLCADPSARWAQMGKECVDARRRKAALLFREQTIQNTTASA
ncbi:C-C motif chemokine 20b [Symphorus nematophorus]